MPKCKYARMVDGTVIRLTGRGWDDYALRGELVTVIGRTGLGSIRFQTVSGATFKIPYHSQEHYSAVIHRG